ncbi:hypothetical protein ACWEFL_02900 [Streptomyces sp. NPDC004838]
MTAEPPNRPVTPRVDTAAADMLTLVDMGVVDPLPEPPPEAPVVPDPDPPATP